MSEHFSIEAEQSVLGGILIRPESFDDVADILREDDFYTSSHRAIWRAMTEVYDKKSPLDIITLAEHLERQHILEEVGGMPYLASMHQGIAGAANIKRYATVVADRARERRTMAALYSSIEVMNEPGETLERLDAVVAQVQEAAESKNRGNGPVRASDLLPAWLDTLETRFNGGGQIPGLQSGFDDFDKLINGLQKSELIVVAGRPSMGKSTFAQNIWEHVAIAHGVPALFFSMEMSKRTVMDRAVSSVGRIPGDKIITGAMEHAEWDGIAVAFSKLQDKGLFIDDTPNLTPTEMRARARRLKRREGIGLIVVDYLQLMRVPGYKNDKVHEIEEISANLKAMAKELDVPVIVISQLSRAVDARADKRPLMSDLRESGAIEQDADVIAFVYRDEAYNPDSNAKGTAEIIVRKNRNGKTGMVRLSCNLHMLRFDNGCFDESRYSQAEEKPNKWDRGLD